MKGKLLSVVKNYKGEATFAISNVVTSVVGMLSGLIAAAFIAPEELGVIQSVLLISTYTTFLNFGVFSGLNRNLAFYKAKGDIEKMQKEIDTSHSVSLVVGGVGFLIGTGVLVYNLITKGTLIYILSSLLLIISLTFYPLTTHIECTFRSGQQFGRYGWIKNVQSFFNAIMALLPIVLGYIGRIMANSFNTVFGYYLRRKYIPYKHRGRGDVASLKDLLSAGLPIMINGYVLSVLLAADRTFIATNLTSYDMGLYTIAGYCMITVELLTNSIGGILYPRASASYGSSGNKRSLLSFWKKSLILYFAVLLPIIGCAYIAMPLLVELFLPKYVEGVDAGKIALISGFTIISNGPSVLFGVLKKNMALMVFTVLCIGLFWGIATFFGGYFTTIESVAILRGVVSLVLSLFVISYSYYLIK